VGEEELGGGNEHGTRLPSPRASNSSLNLPSLGTN